MLTKVDYPGASGINNVEWDAVELLSQFMKNWCYARYTLFDLSKHNNPNKKEIIFQIHNRVFRKKMVIKLLP
jgi:Zn-dependent oligopeptidase